MSDVVVYQRRVKELADRVRVLDNALSAERTSRRSELRILQAQLREGLTPELIALRKEVTRWRDRAQAAEARLKEMAN